MLKGGLSSSFDESDKFVKQGSQSNEDIQEQKMKERDNKIKKIFRG